MICYTHVFAIGILVSYLNQEKKLLLIITLTGLKRMYSVSLFAKNKAMLCRVLVSLDFSNM